MVCHIMYTQLYFCHVFVGKLKFSFTSNILIATILLYLEVIKVKKKYLNQNQILRTALHIPNHMIA